MLPPPGPSAVPPWTSTDPSGPRTLPWAAPSFGKALTQAHDSSCLGCMTAGEQTRRVRILDFLVSLAGKQPHAPLPGPSRRRFNPTVRFPE